MSLSFAGCLCCAFVSSAAAQLDVPPVVPAENRAGQSVPPARPSSAQVQEPARRLFEAITRDRPELAADFFFPRAAFVQVKAMARPERYYDRLKKRFEQDIHALHRATPGLMRAQFVDLDLGRRGGFVRPNEEGNRLPYWAARHALLHYRLDGQLRALEVRVLINWGPRWYVIHLSEFH